MLCALPAIKASAQTLRPPGEQSALDSKMIADAHNSLRQLLPVQELPLLSPLPDATDQLAADILDYANTFIGTRYRIGGKTPKGFDCSGFTGYVFNQFGYSLSASSRAQFSDGRAVPDNEIQAGDLVFFNGRARNGRVGHVGIAISADPLTGVITFIHASVSGGIKIDRTDAPYYSARYIGARRILPD